MSNTASAAALLESAAPGQSIHLAEDFEAARLDHWRSMVDKALKGADFDKRLVSRTADSVAVRPLYTRTDSVVGSDTELPGAAPFTRGRTPMREGLGWDIRTFHSDADPKAVNAAILEDLDGGVNSIALHVRPSALSATPDALGVALDGVLLDVCPIALVADDNAYNAAQALNAVWDAKGIAAKDRQGHFGANPLGILAVTGRLDESYETALARAIALIELTQASPRVTALTADGVAFHNAGASEAQELAAMLATLVAYLRAGDLAGLKPDAVLGKTTVSLAADADEFSTIAKLRAARRLIWRVADACGAGNSAANVAIACPTSYRMLSKRDCWTNILRNTIACTGAALGGADSILVLPFTFALGKSDGFARRVARNIQIVCQEESNLGRVADPAGGSWYVENLTSDIAKKAWELFQDIEARGGMLAALTTGFLQGEIAKTASARAKAIATGKTAITGVSTFPLLGDDGLKADPWPTLPRVTSPAAIEVTPLKTQRLAEPFEALRDAADAAGGFTVFLASMGEIVDHNIRTTWVKNYLAAGGIETLISDGYKTADDAANAFKASGAKAACICSSDEVNATLALPTAAALKAANANLVMMAGKPGDQEAALKAAGVDDFLASGADAIAVLSELQSKLKSLA